MATDVVSVVLEGRPIGELERLARGALRLHFDDDYCADPSATPLSVSMSSSDDSHGDARVAPWLWGLLPDNAEVLARWGRDFGVSIASPYQEVLFCSGACPDPRWFSSKGQEARASRS